MPSRTSAAVVVAPKPEPMGCCGLTMPAAYEWVGMGPTKWSLVYYSARSTPAAVTISSWVGGDLRRLDRRPDRIPGAERQRLEGGRRDLGHQRDAAVEP